MTEQMTMHQSHCFVEETAGGYPCSGFCANMTNVLTEPRLVTILVDVQLIFPLETSEAGMGAQLHVPLVLCHVHARACRFFVEPTVNTKKAN